MEWFAEALLCNAREVLERVGRDAVCLGIGTLEDDLAEFALLVGIKLRRTTLAPAIAKSLDAMLIVAQDPVSQGLPVHARCFGRSLPAHARERIGNRQHPPRDSCIDFRLRQPPQHGRRPILPYRKSRHPRLHSNQWKQGNHDPRACGIPESQFFSSAV